MNFQFCVECGASNSPYSEFCGDCSAELVLTIPDPEIERALIEAELDKQRKLDEATAAKVKLAAEAEAARVAAEAKAAAEIRSAEAAARKIARAPLMKKIRLALTSAVSVLAILIVIAMIPWPKAVSIEVAVDAPNGGVFDSECVLTSQAKEAGVNKVSAMVPGEVPAAGSGTELSFYEIEGRCIGKASLTVSPGASYELYVGTKLAGDLTLQEVEDGKSVEDIPLQVDHKITGTIVLSDNYSNCKDTDKGPDCDIPSNVTIQANVVKNVCYGKNSLADIAQSGSPIKFKGLETGQTASGKLSAGVPSLTDYKTGLITCTYTFEVEGVLHDDAGYAVIVGKHTLPKLQTSEMRSSNWVFDYVFKN